MFSSRPRAGRLAAAGRLISYKSDSSRHANFGAPQSRGEPVGKVVMYSSVSVDGFVADENDQDRCSTGCPAVTSRWTRAAT